MTNASMKSLIVTENHLKLLRRMYVDWNGDEFGAPSIDPKRPYGNSDVIDDICRILGWDNRTDSFCSQAQDIHLEMKHVLQICVLFAGTAITPGTYRLRQDYDFHSWEKVK